MDMIDIEDWASDEVVAVNMNQTIISAVFDIKLRKFNPIDGDTTYDSTRRGGMARGCSTLTSRRARWPLGRT